MSILGNVELAKDLDERLVSHISRGNEKASSIIKEFHMEEIARIRTYMSSFIYDLSNARELNALFHLAVSELNINLCDLLIPGVNVVSKKEDVTRLAI